NMFGAAEDSQAWPFARTDNPLAHVSPPAQLLQTFGLLMFHAPASSLRLTGRGGKGLALFAANLLLVIPNAFAFIRLGLAHPAHLGGKLAHLLLVGAFDDDGGRIRQFHRDAVGRTHGYRVGVANGEDQGLLIQPGLVADAFNPEAFFKTLGDALYHVGDQAAGESMQGTIEPFVVRPTHLDGLGAIVELDFHVTMKHQLQFAFRPLDPHLPFGDLSLDSGRKGDRLFADSRHSTSTFLYQTVHSNSPPSRCDRACRSLMTPRLVLTMPMPRPSNPGSSWSQRRYRRRPGRLARSILRMTRS